MAPMNPLQVQLFTGLAAGRRARFEQSPITFGRSPENVLVIEDTNVSRLHGEIRFEGGQWQLYNHSSNGTKLNRKAIKDKPRPVTDGDEVFVGKQLLFSIHVEPVEASAAHANAPFMPGPGGAGGAGQFGAQAGQGGTNLAGQPGEDEQPKKRSKMWIGIGVYSAMLLGLVIFLSTLGGNGGKVEDNVPQLTKKEIASMISEPLPVRPVDDTKYTAAILEANRLFERRDLAPENAYRCYTAYQEAISYGGLGRDTFKNKDLEAKRRYLAIRDQLIDEVTEAYESACAKLNRGNYEGAVYGFDDVQKRYKNVTSELYKNVEAKRTVASKGLGDKKLKRK